MKQALWLIGFGTVVIGLTLWGGTNHPAIFLISVLGFISLFVGIFKIFGVKSKAKNKGA